MPLHKRILFGCLALIALTSEGGRIAARADQPMEPRSTATVVEPTKALLAAAVASRKALVAGSYRASVVRQVSRHPKHGDARRNAEMQGVFDLPTGRLRYDYMESDRRTDSGRFIATPQESWLYRETEVGRGGVLRRLPPGGPPADGLFRVADARTFGLGLMQDFAEGTTLSEKAAVYDKDTTVALGVADDGDGTVRAEFLLGKWGLVKDSFRLDASRSLPLRVERRYWDRTKGEWNSPATTAETEWERRDDVWVPKVWRARDFNRGPDGAIWTSDLSITFAWKSANAPVDEQAFEPISGLKPMAGTESVDERGGAIVPK